MDFYVVNVENKDYLFILINDYHIDQEQLISLKESLKEMGIERVMLFQF